MESNHRLLDVNQASLPLDHGTELQHISKTSRLAIGLIKPAEKLPSIAPGEIFEMPSIHEASEGFTRQHAPKDLNPDQLVWNQSCCHYTRGVCRISGSRETRTHKSRLRPPVFKTGPSSSRMTSVLSSCGSWNRTNGLHDQSGLMADRCPEPGVTTNSNCSASM